MWTSPLLGGHLAAENAHQRRLARAVLADQCMNLAAPHLEIDAAQGANPAEPLRDGREPRKFGHGVSVLLLKLAASPPPAAVFSKFRRNWNRSEYCVLAIIFVDVVFGDDGGLREVDLGESADSCPRAP